MWILVCQLGCSFLLNIFSTIDGYITIQSILFSGCCSEAVLVFRKGFRYNTCIDFIERLERSQANDDTTLISVDQTKHGLQCREYFYCDLIGVQLAHNP